MATHPPPPSLFVIFLAPKNITDEGLRLACKLPSLTCLNASRCHGITLSGLDGLAPAAGRLRRLNLGWCTGLGCTAAAAAAAAAGGAGDDGGDGGDGGGGVVVGGSDDVVVEGGGGGMAGDAGDGGDGGARRTRRGEWALPVLPELERLCLARLVLYTCFFGLVIVSAFSRVVVWCGAA